MLRRDHGAATRPRSQIAGVPDRAAHEGRDGRRARRPGPHDARARHAGRRRPRRPARHRRHRRRAADVQRLHHRGADRRRRGLRGGQARQPLGHRPAPARPTCSRRSARASTSTPTRWRAASTRPASASCSPPPTTGARATSIPVRKELAVRTIFNFLGPLTNPAGATRQLIGVSDPALPRDDRGRAGAAGRRDGAGSVQRRRSGRDEHVGDHARRRGRRRDELRRYDVAPGGRRAERAPTPTRCARRPPGATTPQMTRARSSPASPAPRATSPLLNAGAAIYVAGRADTLAEGVRRRRGGDRRRRAPRDALERLRGRATPSELAPR